MKKHFGFVMLLLFFMLAGMHISAADTTVYLNDGGTGDGSSATAPLGDLTEAIHRIADGGKVVITDTYRLTEHFVEPTHKGDITISGGTLVFSNTATRYYLSGSGATTFEDLTFRDEVGKGFSIVAQFNRLVMGTGINTSAVKAYVVGGYHTPFAEDIKLDLDSDVTILSGKYHAISGSCRGASSVAFTGTSHITVEDGDINLLFGGSINGSIANNAVITVNGGSINQLSMSGDGTRRIAGESTLTVNGGLIGQLLVKNIMGHATVNYNGGNIVAATKTVEDDVKEFITDGTATLNVNPNLNAAMVALAFDTVNYVGGSTPTATTESAKTTEPADTTAPAKTTEPAQSAETTVVGATEDTATGAEDVATEPEVTTEPAETTAEPEKTIDTEKAADTSAVTSAPAATEEGGANVGLIVGIVIAVIVVAAVVVVVIKKKK